MAAAVTFSELDDDSDDINFPQEFRWHGRVHRVRRVLAHCRLHEEQWRVQAIGDLATPPGVFDLSFDWIAGRWSVKRLSFLREEEGRGVRSTLHAGEDTSGMCT